MNKTKKKLRASLYFVSLAILMVGTALFIYLSSNSSKGHVAVSQEYDPGTIRHIDLEETKTLYVMFDKKVGKDGVQEVNNNTFNIVSQDGYAYCLTIVNTGSVAQQFEVLYPWFENSFFYAIDEYNAIMGFVLEPGSYELKIVLYGNNEPVKFKTSYHDFNAVIVNYLQSYVVLLLSILLSAASFFAVLARRVAYDRPQIQLPPIMVKEPKLKETPLPRVKEKHSFRFWESLILILLGIYAYFIFLTLNLLVYFAATPVPCEMNKDMTFEVTKPETIYFLADKQMLVNDYISPEGNRYCIRLQGTGLVYLYITPEYPDQTGQVYQIENTDIVIDGKCPFMAITLDKGKYTIRLKSFPEYEPELTMTQFNLSAIGQYARIGGYVFIGFTVLALISLFYILLHRDEQESGLKTNSSIKESIPNRWSM